MVNEYSEFVYSRKDIDKAFAMGLESAVIVLEKSIGLSIEGQRFLIETLKGRIEKAKASSLKT